MNETYKILSAATHRKRVQELSKKIDRTLRNHSYENGVAALTMELAHLHLQMCKGKEGEVCVPCASESLTELIQTLRAFHEQMIDEIPSGQVNKSDHTEPHRRDPETEE